MNTSCTCHLLSVLLTLYITDIARSTNVINCPQNNCQDSTINCPQDNDGCFISCNHPNACKNTIIHCPKNQKCDILCDDINSCHSTIIHGSESSIVDIEGCTQDHSCPYITVYCPQYTTDINCFLEGNANLGPNITIYAYNGWSDIDIDYNNSQNTNLGTMHCNTEYTDSCVIAHSDSALQCMDESSACQTMLQISEDTSDQNIELLIIIACLIVAVCLIGYCCYRNSLSHMNTTHTSTNNATKTNTSVTSEPQMHKDTDTTEILYANTPKKGETTTVNNTQKNVVKHSHNQTKNSTSTFSSPQTINSSVISVEMATNDSIPRKSHTHTHTHSKKQSKSHTRPHSKKHSQTRSQSKQSARQRHKRKESEPGSTQYEMEMKMESMPRQTQTQTDTPQRQRQKHRKDKNIQMKQAQSNGDSKDKNLAVINESKATAEHNIKDYNNEYLSPKREQLQFMPNISDSEPLQLGVKGSDNGLPESFYDFDKENGILTDQFNMSQMMGYLEEGAIACSYDQ